MLFPSKFDFEMLSLWDERKMKTNNTTKVNMIIKVNNRVLEKALHHPMFRGLNSGISATAGNSKVLLARIYFVQW